MKKQSAMTFSRTAIASALLVAFGGAHGEEVDELAQYTKPDSQISASMGYLSDDAVRFGQYSGIRSRGLYGSFDVLVNSRDDAGGTWSSIRGSNLTSNLDRSDASLRVDVSKAGLWRGYVDFNQKTRFDPLEIRTRFDGVGSAAPADNNAGALRLIETPSTVRERVAFGLDSAVTENVSVGLRVQSEDKSGTRIYGFYPNLFALEPIKSKTDQWEAKVGYTADRLQINVGYYGSRYSNSYDSLLHTQDGTDGRGTATNPYVNVPNQTHEMGLPPDNLSHQLYVNGGYNFTNTTRGSFKVSFTRAEQDDEFFTTTGLRSTVQGLTSLGAKLDTTLVTAGVTSRPMKNLNVLASLRYEDRDDKTPERQFVDSNTGSRSGFNMALSRTSLSGKVEAGYRLPQDYKLVAGLDYEEIERNAPPQRQASWREKNDEIGGRLELRKVISETLSGSVKYQHSDRGGSDFLNANTATDQDVIAPIHFADRKRDKARLGVDWAPQEALSLQFVAEFAVDDYENGPNDPNLGPDKGTAQLASIDAVYALSDDWKLSGWLSHDETNTKGQSCDVTSGTCNVTTTSQAWNKWSTDLTVKTDAVGFGAQGALTNKITVSLNASAAVSKASYLLTNNSFDSHATNNPELVGVIPDHEFKSVSLSLQGDYQVDKDVTVSAFLQHERTTTDDWQWTDGAGGSYRYDTVRAINGTTLAPGELNTTVSQPAKETINFVGIQLKYKWW